MFFRAGAPLDHARQGDGEGSGGGDGSGDGNGSGNRVAKVPRSGSTAIWVNTNLLGGKEMEAATEYPRWQHNDQGGV